MGRMVISLRLFIMACLGLFYGLILLCESFNLAFPASIPRFMVIGRKPRFFQINMYLLCVCMCVCLQISQTNEIVVPKKEQWTMK